MRRFGFIVFFASTLLLPAEDVPAPSPGPLDLQRCFELAVLQTELLPLKHEDAKVAEAQYWQALSGLAPNISLEAENLWRQEARGQTSSANRSRSARTALFESTINVRQPIFHGFRQFHEAASAKASQSAAIHEFQRTRELLYLDVADVFYQILTYEGDLQVLTDEETANRARITELKRRIELGRSRNSELLLAQSELADTLAIIEQTRGLSGASRELLAFLTGVPAKQQKLLNSHPFPKVEELASYIQQTYGRSDVLAAMEKETAARKDLSATRSDYLPSADLDFAHNVSSDPEVEREWNVTISISVPIFEGGITQAREAENKALVRQARLNLARLERTAIYETRLAYNDFISSSAELVRLRELVRVASENYKLQKQDYDAGLVSNLDVIAALRRQHDARRRLVGVSMNARNDFVRLTVAAGRDPIKLKAKP